MKVLLSIKPEFVEKIINGEKKYEYRKRIFKKEVEKIVVYSTMPVGKIVCELKIEEVINDSPEKIWVQTSKYSGVNEDFFMKYFSDRNNGYALKISEVHTFDEPIDPREKFDNFVAPQSFKYIEDSLIG